MIQDASGLLNIYKPSSISSFGVVKQAKRILDVKKAGHCGTLDPLAEGVLLIVFGRATKMQQAFMQLRKTYHVSFLLGTVTDSGDITGKIIARKPARVFTGHETADVLRHFTGDIQQIPPMYSALKYGGMKLYEIARQGREVIRAPRTVTIYRMDVVSCKEEQPGKYILELIVECSRGTYIRTLGEDIGAKLGCGATVEYLCRTSVGAFTSATALRDAFTGKTSRDILIEQAYSMEKLQEMIAIS